MIDTARRRLTSQRLARPLRSPFEVVAWMGAVQAQDLAAARWALGVRSRDMRASDVDRALERGTIVRLWPMRSTLHFVPASQAHAMLAHLAPRALRRVASRERELGLTPRVLARSRRVLTRALEGGQRLTRPRAYALLDANGIATRGQRGFFILGHLAQGGLLCQGPREGQHPTFVLLDEWVRPPHHVPDRRAFLADLAGRFVRSHGPLEARDFAWWAGLPLTEARSALAAAKGAREADEGWIAKRTSSSPSRRTAHLLPAFDEFLVAYKDRSASLARIAPRRLGPELLLSSTIVLDGQVVGTWTRSVRREAVRLGFRWFTRVEADEKDAVSAAAERYARFRGLQLEMARGR